MISIKSKKEIDKMKKAGEIVALAHNLIEENITPGISTLDLDRMVEELIIKNGAVPSFKGVKGLYGAVDYPASICASVNEEVVHGLPGLRSLKNGDIISVDIGAFIDGYHGDAARTYAVGNISPEAEKLIRITKESFYEGIKHAIAGNRIIDISRAIQKHVEQNGYTIVRDYVGHGIGTQMHELPQIPNYVTRERGPRLASGMTLAIEPMVNEGTYKVELLDNKWTVVTADGRLSAHYENTIAVTDDEPIILTKI